MNRALVASAVALSLILPAPALASRGVDLLFPQYSALATAIARQPDGKLVVGGDTKAGVNYGVVRLTAKGRVDKGFGKAGMAQIHIGKSDFNDLTSVLVAPDGGILATGTAGTDNSQQNGSGTLFGIARLRPNGSLDTSFHENGTLRFTFSGGGDTGMWLVRRPDGSYASGGDGDFNGAVIEACSTLLDANLDAPGDGSALCTSPPGSSSSYFGQALPQPDGSVIVSVGGFKDDSAGGTPMLGIGRIAPGGQLDTSFGDQGMTVTSFASLPRDRMNQLGKTLVAARPGGFVVAGPGTTGFGLAGFDAQGALDQSFGTGGKVEFNADGAQGRDIVADLVPQPGGKFVVVGQSERTSRDSPGTLDLVRFNANGTLDKSFGTGGRAIFTAQKLGVPSIQQADSALALPDGSFIVVGASRVPYGRYGAYAMLIAKFKPNGSLDRRFGG